MADPFERFGDFARCSAISRVTLAEARAGSSASGSSHRFEAFADGLIGEISELDTVRARVRERCVGGTGAGKVGVQLDHVADVDDDQERWPAFIGRQGAGVAFGLAASALQGVVKTFGGARKLDFLGLQHVAAALVAVDAATGAAAVTVGKVTRRSKT